MRNTLKILSLIFAIIMIVSVFASCDNTTKSEATTTGSADSNEQSSSESTESTTQTETETEATPNVGKNNYGADFHLLIQPQSNRTDYYWVEESKNDALSEAIFNRQQQVYEYLGVDIVASVGDGHDQYGIPFMAAVKNKDGSIDTLLSHAYMFLSQFISGGYLKDFNDIEQIDLEADYWSLDVMEEVAAADHLYLGYSDFRLAHTTAITYNKSMLDRYSDALDESIYDTVINYRWTIDKMISLANLVYIDTTSNGKTDDDTFGITGRQWEPFINFVQASNLKLVDLNEQGDYEVAVYTDTTKEKTTTLVEKLSELSKSNYAWFKFREEAVEVITIASNKTLLYYGFINEFPQYLDYDVDFGILPYPMFDEAQKNVGYRSLDWGGWLCVPSYVEDINKVGDTLDVLSFFSHDVTITYYEKLLGKQVADAPEDRAMLDIIWDSICSDIGLTYSHIVSALDNNLYMLPTVTQANATEELASFVKGYSTAANKSLKKYFGAINKMG